jgi:hypothetical protein
MQKQARKEKAHLKALIDELEAITPYESQVEFSKGKSGET